MLLPELRERVWKANIALPENNLVTWTSGNVSGRDPETNLIVIKPSGVMFPELTPENMVVVDLDGKVIEGDLKPSSDVVSHLYIYRHRSDLNGIVHTHSPFATAFAALGREISVYLTSHADEFGGPIPCGGFALIGGAEIGRIVVETIGSSPAVLLKNHGVFTVGQTGEAAVKAAVMVEDVARTVWYALQIGQPEEIPPDLVEKLHDRYTNIYGQ